MISKNINISLVNSVRSNLRGFLTSLTYEIRNESGDWSQYFGQYEGQKHNDIDSNCCWAFAGNEVLEDQLEYLWKNNFFSEETKKWFRDNGYIDSDGDFYLSRRFIPTLSGVTNNGNDQAEFWRLTKIYGAIPSALLPFTNNTEYFDKSKITPAMYALGKQFLTKVNIEYEEVGKRWKDKDYRLLQGELLQSELQIGIPVSFYGWNQKKVDYDGQRTAAHSVALYKIDMITDPEYPYYIYDQYNPNLKQLSKDYYIPIVTKAVVTATPQLIVNPVSQVSLFAKIWKAIIEDWFARFPAWHS